MTQHLRAAARDLEWMSQTCWVPLHHKQPGSRCFNLLWAFWPCSIQTAKHFCWSSIHHSSIVKLKSTKCFCMVLHLLIETHTRAHTDIWWILMISKHICACPRWPFRTSQGEPRQQQYCKEGTKSWTQWQSSLTNAATKSKWKKRNTTAIYSIMFALFVAVHSLQLHFFDFCFMPSLCILL